MIKRLYFLINSALEADFKRLKLEEIDFKVIENRTPLFNPFNLATKYFLSKKFKQKHYFYYLVLKLFHKVWNVKDELDLLFTKNPSTSKNIIFIAHDRILNSIWSEHLEQFKDNISIFTINTDRNFNKINTLISKHCKILSPISCSPKLIVVGNCLNVFLLKAIRKAYPSAHIAVWFYDDFSEFLSSKNIEKISSYKRDLNKLNINIWDYNKVYSSRYNFTYQPNAVNFNYLRSLSNLNKNNNYIFYAGSVEPVDDRFDFLYHFLTTAAKLNFKLEFYISNLSEQQKDQISNLNQLLGYTAVYTDTRISYSDYITKISSSSIIIDFYKFYPSEGYSYRIPEAIAMNKKIITNRTCVIDEDFYNPDYIFICDEVNKLGLSSFLKKNISPNYINAEQFNIINVISNFL